MKGEKFYLKGTVKRVMKKSISISFENEQGEVLDTQKFNWEDHYYDVLSKIKAEGNLTRGDSGDFEAYWTGKTIDEGLYVRYIYKLVNSDVKLTKRYEKKVVGK